MNKETFQNKYYRTYSSATKSILIHLGNFKFSHKDSPEDEDVYIGRDQLESRLKSWLTSDSEFGSYLVAGYRGMGKSSLVNHTLDKIVREKNPIHERWYRISLCALLGGAFCMLNGWVALAWLCGICCLVTALVLLQYRYGAVLRHMPFVGSLLESWNHTLLLDDFRNRTYRSEQRYQRIHIKVNLGREVMNERDVLCLITNSIRTRYKEFLRMVQNKPAWIYLRVAIIAFGAYWLTKACVAPIMNSIADGSMMTESDDSILLVLWNRIFRFLNDIDPSLLETALNLVGFCLSYLLMRSLMRRVFARFDRSRACLRRLDDLAERLSSSVSESEGNLPNFANSVLNISLFSRRHRDTPVANVRDIETELIEVINTINSRECFRSNRVLFLIVLDELDKVEQRADKAAEPSAPSRELTPPDFTTAVDGFSGSISHTDRRRMILQLLANMKLFLTSARAKFIFISGRELYEAFLADLSDREFAISSIFSGVIDVNSFLFPERDQSDIGSMTEQYVSEILIPKNFLRKKMLDYTNLTEGFKREIPSLRWYTEYLSGLKNDEKDSEILREQTLEIRRVVMFLHCFTIYLSHISNGSPKKIALYFEKYVRLKNDVRQSVWDDTLEYGVPNRYVLYFTPQDQQKIGFIFHLAAPIMDVITNNVSNYDDKMLIAASFIVDHLFKFHGRGFSWRNIEQTPELLDVNKTPELRDFITSIVEFLQQFHLSSIMVGLFQFKFRKRISEEISYMTRISDEAAAMFNFTLNESQAVKQHNIQLLNYLMELNRIAGDDVHADAIARIHATLGDLYFQEEDYTRAIQEYRNVLSQLDRHVRPDGSEPPASMLTRIRCMLKLGLTCEYRKTFDTAYITYCRLVNAMISVREVNEKNIGLDIVDTWTGDWRVKQPMIVDFGVRHRDDLERKKAQNVDGKRYNLYRSQNVNGIWEDNFVTGRYDPAEYSLDFDAMVSGFAKNLTPEKSRFIMNLSMFEDVRLIYKAILAKLFVLEKMNMSGITQSNLEIAIAEFKYLHRTINLREKFFIAADFFNQLGKILFYKNSLSLLPEGQISSRGETFYEMLFWWNIDLLAYLDDFCFERCNPQNRATPKQDAIGIKNTIRTFFKNFRVEPFPDEYPGKFGSIKLVLTDIDPTSVVHDYLHYLVRRLASIDFVSHEKVIDCFKHRKAMREEGWNTPCYACRFYNLSLNIMMERMFVGKGEMNKQLADQSKALSLLQYSFRKYLRIQRVHHLRLLATSILSLGNTMVSCSSDKIIRVDVLILGKCLLSTGNDDCKEQIVNAFISEGYELSKLDRAFLYYLAAYRYFSLACQPKDAGDSLLKILKLIDEQITVYNFDKKTACPLACASDAEKLKSDEREELSGYECLLGDKGLLPVLFTRLAKAVNEQYGYSSIPEMHEYKWMFHMSDTEDLSLERLHINSELKEAIWLIADIRIKYLNIRRYYSIVGNPLSCDRSDAHAELQKRYREEIAHTYKHFGSLCRVSDTFYNEIITYYARFRCNKWILKDMFGGDPLVCGDDSHQYAPGFVVRFVEALEKYLSSRVDPERLDSLIFHVKNDVRDKRELVEFLLEDSITCLSEIIYVLTPYNHISSFSNSFVAEVYTQLWEHAKMYETLVQIYQFRYNPKQRLNINGIFKIWSKTGIEFTDQLQKAMSVCGEWIDNDDLEKKLGKLNDRFFMRMRHHIDDRTFHHVISNYAAEMALRYYVLSETSHSEGTAYRNQINRNYVLNDDLDNDTWLLTTTLERYRLHTGYIRSHRRRLAAVYRRSRFYKIETFMNGQDMEKEFDEIFADKRFEDSIHTNSLP